MKQVCKKFDGHIISAYADGETLHIPAMEIAEHVEKCDVCRSRIKEYNAMSGLLGSSLKIKSEDQSFTHMEHEVISKVKSGRYGGLQEWFRRLSPGRMYLQAACLVAIMFAVVGVIKENPYVDMEPSAIVNSVDGEVSQVMIFEVADSHTVIWFSET